MKIDRMHFVAADQPFGQQQPAPLVALQRAIDRRFILLAQRAGGGKHQYGAFRRGEALPDLTDSMKIRVGRYKYHQDARLIRHARVT